MANLVQITFYTFRATLPIAVLIFIVLVTGVITLLAREKHTWGVWNVA
jgi:hypothetical protein